MSVSVPSSLALTGSLTTSPLESNSIVIEPNLSQSQPSILWKGLAFFFMGYLAPGLTDLSGEQKAIFITTIDQLAVPGGSIVPHDVRNYQVFAKADPMQTQGQVFYDIEKSSYFERLSMYLRYLVEGEDTDGLETARLALLQAKEAKNEAWEAARSRYIAQTQSGLSGQPMSAAKADGNANLSQATDSAFAAYIRQDEDYIDAYNVELKQEQEYTRLLGPQMQAITSRLDTIKFADDRIDYRVGNNMSCTALSEDFVKGAPSSITSRDQYFRPLYSLTDYDTICDSWLNAATRTPVTGSNSIDKRQLHIKDAADRPWAALGHPALDGAKVPNQSLNDRALLEAVKVFVSFVVEPKAIDIQRGLWNVPNPREFGRLAEKAPDSVKQPFCKTVKMLISWNIEIFFELPPMVGSLSARDVDFAPLGLQPEPLNEDGSEWRWKSERLAYPILLAVLANVV